MGKKKKAPAEATIEITMSKKERKALEAREAELAAKLAAREQREREVDKAERKAAKKAKKKSKGEKFPEASLGEAMGQHTESVAEIASVTAVADTEAEVIAAAKAEREAARLATEDATPDQVRTAAEKVLADPNATPGAREKAEAAKARAEEDAEIKARVQAKRAARDAGEPVDVKSARNDDALDGETEADYQMRKLKEKVAAKKAERQEQVSEVVETEEGRIFETGTPSPEAERPAFVNPSDAPRELEEGRNGYKIIQLDADGKPDPRKVRQMTRVTTFVGNIDDETTLRKWDKRMVAEGLAGEATNPKSGGVMVATINDIAHRRDVKIAKAIKADRKGKLGIGEVGHLIAAAEKEAKDALDAIVEEAAALAGRNDKANFGTHLHTLAEISDERGIDAVRDAHESGELVAHENDGRDGMEPMPVTATDLASIEAYAERMARLGAKVVHSEAVIVNDDMGYAGRLDRVIMARLPELEIGDWTRPADQRARRYIADIKSGRIDLGAGKIARQLAAYALGDVYDLETGERSKHSAVRDVALVFHLPQGEGVCTVHAVDLKAGVALLKLSAEVRRARNTGRKTIDTTVDIADPATD